MPVDLYVLKSHRRKRPKRHMPSNGTPMQTRSSTRRAKGSSEKGPNLRDKSSIPDAQTQYFQNHTSLETMPAGEISTDESTIVVAYHPTFPAIPTTTEWSPASSPPTDAEKTLFVQEASDTDDRFTRSPSAFQDANENTDLQRNALASDDSSETLVQTAPQCECFATLVLLLDDLGTSTASITWDKTAWDKLLATHKYYLARCGTVLCCHACISKADAVMLLVLVYEKLVSFCEEITAAFLKCRLRSPEASRSAPSRFHQRAWVGEYRANTEGEWEYLVGALMMYQVEALETQMIEWRSVFVLLERSRISRWLACERKLEDILWRLQNR